MRIAATFILLASTLICGGAMAQDTKTIRLGTATPGGGFPVYGAAFIEAIQAADPTLKIEAINTKGSTENVPLLEAGKLDLGLVQGEVVHEALSHPTNLRILTAMYPTAGMFVVRADSPYRSISDLKGKPIALGAKGSGLTLLARYVLDGVDLDAEKDFTAITLDKAGDGPAMVLDGRAAALWGGGTAWPGFTAVATSAAGARFIAPDSAEIARILAKHNFLKPMTAPAGGYPGQTEAIQSVGSWSFVMVRGDLDEETVYRLARALHKAEAAKSSQLAETTAANTLAAMAPPMTLHPGVARYFKEIGITK